MVSATDVISAISSITLRICGYVFLRWFLPRILSSLGAVYVVSFAIGLRKTSPYNVLSDELEIVTKETTIRPSDTESSDGSDAEGAGGESVKELDVQETVTVERRDPKILKTLLLGSPSPASGMWSLATFAINAALMLMCADLTLSSRLFHQAHDLAFARAGYVSHDSANILIREPRASELPLFLSYRRAEYLNSADTTEKILDDAWKSAGTVTVLSNETDFTTTLKIPGLYPDTRYQYATSNNQTGFFITAPPIGHVSKRSSAGESFTFLHSSCIKPRVPYTPFAHPLSIPGLRTLSTVLPKLYSQRLKPAFMLFLGDFIYVDVPHRFGTDIETYRREYRQVYASPDWSAVNSAPSAELPWLHVWDDHEIANDWASGETGVLLPAADAFGLYNGAPNPPPVTPNATYSAFTQGPLSFFLLDTRRYRSPPPHANATMLGEAQLAALLDWLRAPPPHPRVRWKVVVSSVPFTKNWRFGGEDTWGGFLRERRKVLDAMWAASAELGVGIVVLSGDRHEFGATAFPAAAAIRDAEGGGEAAPHGLFSGAPGEIQQPVVHEFSASPLGMFYLPWRTYKQEDGEDVRLKYLPDGNSKVGVVSVEVPEHGEQSVLTYRLYIDGEEAWRYVLTTPMRGEMGRGDGT
ncbi:PhoD-like phosphatase-domain-containing protein [Lineolata rhizophorae]|uniref:PhoD-like phosphatase-domain-containing protein n=1 Tax=Lineolata rhizophorae TaxID=578093 RepID=A0A6A6NUW2_9PEZI|nr:PhoD-like phosphatase-domain-containing protein [Lineolata rhizophorae]